MNNLATINILSKLYRVVEDGEKGYAVASSNVSNRALKILFSAYAQQRLKFKEEISAEVQRLGGSVKSSNDILGVIHRGRIDIFAALTIGAENVEKVLLKEILLGERFALRAYQSTLKKQLPAETKALVEYQSQEVLKVVDQVRLMRGKGGKRLLLRLYDSESDARQAMQELERSGFSQSSINLKDINYITGSDLYNKGRGTTIAETIISGAVGGGTWGTVAGILAVINIMQISASNLAAITPAIYLLAFLGLMAGGVFIGSMIGLFIGWGISSDDKHITDIIERGQILLDATVDLALASKAWRIMYQVATAVRADKQARGPLNKELL